MSIRWLATSQSPTDAETFLRPNSRPLLWLLLPDNRYRYATGRVAACLLLTLRHTQGGMRAVQYRAEEDEDSTSTAHVLRLAVVGRPGTAYYGFESLRSLARHMEHGVRTRDLERERERTPGTPFLMYAFLPTRALTPTADRPNRLPLHALRFAPKSSSRLIPDGATRACGRF